MTTNPNDPTQDQAQDDTSAEAFASEELSPEQEAAVKGGLHKAKLGKKHGNQADVSSPNFGIRTN